MDEDGNQYVNRVSEDHYLHWFVLIGIVVWAGTVFGWIAGILTAMALIVAISLTNTILLARTGSLRATRYSRWGWLAVAAALIVALSVETVRG